PVYPRQALERNPCLTPWRVATRVQPKRRLTGTLNGLSSRRSDHFSQTIFRRAPPLTPDSSSDNLPTMKYPLLIVTGLVGLMSLNTASAQELRGIIRGVITDSSGSFVVGAQVSLKNISTNIQVHRESNDVGQYLFDFVSPGAYTLNVEMQGFRSFIQENILVQTRSDVTVNARLEVGQLT